MKDSCLCVYCVVPFHDQEERTAWGCPSLFQVAAEAEAAGR